jgi:hypothetical protein
MTARRGLLRTGIERSPSRSAAGPCLPGRAQRRRRRRRGPERAGRHSQNRRRGGRPRIAPMRPGTAHRSVDPHDRVSSSCARRSANPPIVEQVQTIAPGSRTASSRRRARTRASMPASRPCLPASLSSSASTRCTSNAPGATSLSSPLNVATCTSAVCRKATVRTSGVNHVRC